MATIQNFLATSGFIPLFVLGLLSFYLILTLWVFFYKYISIKSNAFREQQALEAIMAGARKDLRLRGMLFSGAPEKPTKEWLAVWKNQLLKENTTGLVVLSIIASTAPFVGLFGTVVEILEAFGRLSGQVSFDVIAPVISKALVATAAGILTAIPAYSFFLILKRKVYDLSVYAQMQIDFLMAKEHDGF
ncbi:Biopolymer transport protein ExbB [Helicobacter sp. NHP19-012]|uniref:Biopolymer transport protein ExbB n=1 Tax=Helicobacter gastrofelis TaxID=2849642 RepID=A0ABM7SE29_9HELI|nr:MULTISPECIES: MotA/TolQ/ExbB proton channel family protein [unclassified Helicobacter]BCZ18622.1 Biopolymer transport protein ExbB [Helicobacter sp. NHP19-012]GMB95891.1 Biopolymer transport protein ExbB [Helicobacter sp. NHP22-001]